MTGAEAVAHFAPEGSSAGGARRFVAATLRGWDLEVLEEVACLLVSELVSNVVLHAATDLELRLRRLDAKVRVEVHDGVARMPERKFYSPTSTTGRGLVFLAELAQDWGAEPTPSGKAVWFELDETPPPAAPAAHVVGELSPEDWEDWEDWDDLSVAGDLGEPRDETLSAGGHALRSFDPAGPRSLLPVGIG